jgi:hypothetical protein
MDNMFTLSQPTELRSLRQILAEINKSKMALDEAYFGIQRKQIEIKKLKRTLINEKDNFEKDLININIAELKNQIANTMGYVEGAIRKISAYLNQYKNILTKLGRKEFTEEDFEKDEERYHIMTAFTQALCAARSRSGIIDEGNHIYFHQIGINGTMAQFEITKYLKEEGELLVHGNEIHHDRVIDWLNNMAIKYQGCAIKYSGKRNMKLLDSESCHKG